MSRGIPTDARIVLKELMQHRMVQLMAELEVDDIEDVGDFVYGLSERRAETILKYLTKRFAAELLK